MGEAHSRPADRPQYMDANPYPRQGPIQPFMHQLDHLPDVGKNVKEVKAIYASISDQPKDAPSIQSQCPPST